VKPSIIKDFKKRMSHYMNINRLMIKKKLVFRLHFRDISCVTHNIWK